MSNVVRLDARAATGREAAARGQGASPSSRVQPLRRGQPAPGRAPSGYACLGGGAHEEAPDAEYVIHRLEEAGCTLLTLPGTGYSTRLRTSNLDVVRAAEAFGSEAGGRIRPPAPSAVQITRMDEALGWITMIPQDRYVLRRIVGARSLVSPTTERHLYSWRRLGTVLGADHKAVQRWHATGIEMIVAVLNDRGRV